MADQQELAKDEIIEQVKSAFSPNFCAVQSEFIASMWCEVFDKNQSGRSERFMIDKLGDYRTRDTLGKILQQWREVLANDGYELPK